jgi:hypothetical protein
VVAELQELAAQAVGGLPDGGWAERVLVLRGWWSAWKARGSPTSPWPPRLPPRPNRCCRRLDPPRLRRAVAPLRLVADPDRADHRTDHPGPLPDPTPRNTRRPETGASWRSWGPRTRAEWTGSGAAPGGGGAVAPDPGRGPRPSRWRWAGPAGSSRPANGAALAVRDGGGGFPGCARPLAWYEAHQLRHWRHGGPTDLANLALLCRAHHRAVHEGGWRLQRHPDGQLTATPPHRPHQRAPTAA